MGKMGNWRSGRNVEQLLFSLAYSQDIRGIHMIS